MQEEREEMEKWERNAGVKFLKKIGLGPGQVVLDFGAGVGHYTIPAAIVVGEEGKVYSIDKRPDALNEVERKARLLGLGKIILIITDGEVHFKIENGSFDVVFLYDVLHYLEGNVRTTLYQELHRMLKPDGLLSVYPKHVKGDHPRDKFEKLHIKDVKKEIMKSGFRFEGEFRDVISHDNSLNPGCVLNFRRTIWRNRNGKQN